MLCRRISPLAPLALVLALSLSACSDDGKPSSPDSSVGSTTAPTTAPTTGAAGLAIELTREGDTFTPNGARVEAQVNVPITLTITSDTAGELHVHSMPEQEVAYDAGTSEHMITIDKPGVVEVESHDPDSIVLQLEVR